VSDDFLSRWSRRKIAARAGQEPPPAPAAAAPAAAVMPPTAQDAEQPAPAPLPPVESLTPESDFTPFMKAEVDPATRRQALKTLFADPQFNVMDGLDVYIDDYSKPDPLPEGWLAKMNQVARLGEYIAPVEKDEAPQSQPSETAGSPPSAVHPEDLAAVQSERGDGPPDSPSKSEGMPTAEG
jgi:hypothetical protein